MNPMPEQSTEKTPPPDGLMRRRVMLPDGRYILFYTSADERGAEDSETAGKPEAVASPAPVDSQPIADDAIVEKS